MSLPTRQDVSAAHRVRVLRALGITPWARRELAGDTVRAAALGAVAEAPVELSSSSPRVVVVLGEGSSARELDLLGRALGACGAALARAARITVSGEQLRDVPDASAYLVFGAAQARALGRSLPVEVMQRAQVELVDELGQVLSDAGAKRRLWGALRRLRQTPAVASG